MPGSPLTGAFCLLYFLQNPYLFTVIHKLCGCNLLRRKWGNFNHCKPYRPYIYPTNT
jgi:hypothetical protein